MTWAPERRSPRPSTPAVSRARPSADRASVAESILATEQDGGRADADDGVPVRFVPGGVRRVVGRHPHGA